MTTITMPADFVENVTQDSLDENAGETYVSAKLNSDGSVTNKMTKAQHKAMYDGMKEAVEEAINEMVTCGEYTYTKIDHNEDFTEFDIYLSTEELGLAESVMTMAFYMYGGVFEILSGHDTENIEIRYYGVSGNLINTANSSDLG